MTDTFEHSRQPGSPLGARAEAAALFAAAITDEAASTAARLNCLAAQLALQVSSMPARPAAEDASADALITRGLRILGSLSVEQFADSRVRAACRYGRLALRGDGR
jgi:hypothetical protein